MRSRAPVSLIFSVMVPIGCGPHSASTQAWSFSLTRNAAAGRGVDHFADPLIYSDNQTLVWSVRAVGFVDLRARLLDVEKPLESAYDRYALLRSVYLQRREYHVHDGDVPEELEAEPMLDILHRTLGKRA